MTCREFIQFLLEYRDGLLGDQERGRFDAHLEKCPACRSYLDTYGRTIELARATSDDAVPDDVPAELVEAILRSRRS